MASRLSTVHRGVAFEQRSLEVLQYHLSMSLQMVGGKSDGGVDLQGWWWVPPTSRRISSASPPVLSTGKDGETRQRLRVLGQCKAEVKKMGPNYVREMEGVLHRHYSVSTGQPVIEQPVVALLVSQSAFTRSTILRALSSPLPFFLLHLPLPKEKRLQVEREGEDNLEDELGAAICNPALAGGNGLLGGEMEVRWERSFSVDGGRPGLWCKGKRLKGWIPKPNDIEP